jgi:putative aldouronate transport system substrate-binding protein
MKKSAILLAAALILSLFAGCGDGSASTAAESAVSSGSSAEAASEPLQEAPADAAVDSDQETASAEEAMEVAESTGGASIVYPIADGDSLTAWVTLETPFRQAIEDWNDLSVLPNIAEATGIDLSFITVGSDAASEQFPLMIAGGDWTDLIPISYYTGGDSQAYEDDVIVDLTDLLEENAPDYWSIAQGMDSLSQSAMISGDKYLTFYTLLNQYYLIQGPCIRQDWLDELNLDAPTDLDSLTETLKAFYDNYHPDYTIYTSDGGLDYLSDLFGTMISGYTTLSGSLPIYVDGEDVVCTYTTDAYREFLEWFAEMYQYGVINDSFYSINEMDGTVRNTYIAEGQIGYWSARCESIDEWKTYTSDENVLATANPQATSFLTDEDGVFNWAEEQSRLYSRVSWCITTACQSPETALQFLNYFFTDEGSILANYGTEGYTWEYDANGDVAYTDVVLNNPDDYTAQLAVNVYTTSAILPCYSIEEKLFVSYCDNAQTAIALYNDNVQADHAYPSAAALTTTETNQITGTVTNIMTYSSEQLLQFMTCAVEITDETWQAYEDQMQALGLDDVMAVYQNAYSEYLAGQR